MAYESSPPPPPPSPPPSPRKRKRLRNLLILVGLIAAWLVFYENKTPTQNDATTKTETAGNASAPAPKSTTKTAETASAPALKSTQNDTQSENYIKVAIALHVITFCVVPATNAAKGQDTKYLSDALFVLGFMQHGMDEGRVKQATSAVEKHVKEIGLEAFCRQNKPALDEVVELARKEYADELNASFQDFVRNPGGGKK